MAYIDRFKIFYGNILCLLKSAVEKLREAAPQSINIDLMNVEEIHAELQEGYEDIKAGKVQEAASVFAKFRESH